MKQEINYHVFLEDIIYCPSQIFYYFEDTNKKVWCVYVRQRGGPLRIELDSVDEDISIEVKLSREYDINNQSNLREERREINELEKDIISYLKRQFPEVKFPEQIIRKEKEY